jgi:hypothetical protein
MYGLPDQFDKNEIVLVIAGITFVLLFILLPKRFPPSITIMILIFGSFSARLGDIMFFPFNLYNVMDDKKHNLFDFYLYSVIYSFYVYFYCYFYDKVKLKNGWQLLHIFIWVLISISLEWLGTQLDVYKYLKWKLHYSAIIYLLMFLLYTIMLKTCLTYYEKHRHKYS